MFAASGDTDRALLFAETMLRNTTDPTERKQIEKRIQAVHLESRLRALEDAARRFHQETGRWPTGPVELTAKYGLPPAPPGVTLVEGVASAPPGEERMLVYRHAIEGDYRTAQ